MPTNPDFIVLHERDNVATALRCVPAALAAGVASASGILPSVTPSTEIRLGHKIAIRPIAAGDLVVKHGQPIGRATAVIHTGEHVHTHNVVSLSRESDVAERE